jgi:hypothetical protein
VRFRSQRLLPNVHEKPRALGRAGALVAVGFAAAMTLPIATTIAAPSASAAGGCQTKLAMIKGNPVEISCGPASAKLRYKGKTYFFKSGTCRSLSSGGQKGGTLSLGKNTSENGNAGLVGLSIGFLGNGQRSATVTANQGKVYINDGAATATRFGSTGTIKGTNGGAAYTVSWNCGGAPSKG